MLLGISARYRRHLIIVTAIMAALFFMPAGSAKGQAPERSKGPVDLSTAIIQVAKKNIPAVVHIEVTGQQEIVMPSLPFEDDPFFRYFFGLPKGPRKYRKELKGLGTGMIYDARGHILTNYHVVGGATRIDVVLSNGSKYGAKLVGSDPKTDLAVIRISTKERLPSVTFGDSDKVQVGEWVVAIGHPRGLDQTVTQGIISAKHRTGITDPSSYQDFLQTDAAINPGNSGGPLLNLRGEVIGVNTIIVSGSGGFEGIGLAIPGSIALHVAKLLIAHGKVERGWLGVSVQDPTPENAKALGVAARKGALIADIVKGGPADRAGLRKGDIVVSYQSKEISNGASLRNEAATTPVGSEARVTIIRGGKKQDLKIRIGAPKEAAKALAASVKERLGVEVRALTQKEAGRRGLGSAQGVLITWVEPKGPLGRVGFEAGDMILEVNGQAVSGPENFIELVALLKPKQQVTLLAVDHSSGSSGYVQAVVR
ncbi:Do family serine endopeptidase [Syntrophorhabdus aromaticivorans]|uniref:Do family serine endopeptidase n=1 Tax=Syntrophorhabdus aromaticivorans TaxID=328301 RepID=A0A971S0H9_9BACT|nr:Do family serine endopeptidase [Syntrophorhabdus aromaticivorans]NLW34112.1 Do family serine endopeptidase [Syntrophorhabdus aromaticivorans]